MPSRRSFRAVLPLVPAVVGWAVSAWRFRVQDPIGGLAIGIAGLLAMMVLAARMPDEPGE
jgi:hypothetical protein